MPTKTLVESPSAALFDDPLVCGAIAAAIDRSQAVIEFEPDGTVVAANQHFLDTMGYALDEIVGRHHRTFCVPDEAAGAAYEDFWHRLAAGEFATGEFRRVAKGGRSVWLQATYNPILGDDGSVRRVVKIASDVTARKNLDAEFVGKVAAISRAQAVIEFEPDGTIITANRNFLDIVGYDLADIEGKHHSLFVDPRDSAGDAYGDFWKRLAAGEYVSGEFRRIGRDQRVVWLHATYNPIIDSSGCTIKVVKFASDITAQKLATVEAAGKVAAIDRSQAVIEFELDGTVITANQNFLDAVGYRLSEVVGQHHRMFCDPEYARSDAYVAFWDRLGAGNFAAGEYRRRTKTGGDLWLQATYNPIIGADGVPTKVVKYATDVTDRKLASIDLAGRIDAVNRAQAVIEFDLDGIVLEANENFLRAMGYSQREVVGRHHSTFCTDEYIRTEEYRDFWLRLGKGEVLSGRFHRVGKYGRDVHIQATYNPIIDPDGKVIKVVKYAYDVTPQVERETLIAAHTKQMSDSVRSLAGSIDVIANGSTEANRLAKETEDNAQQGVRELQAALEAIELIQKSSSSIAQIVQVMSEIANQTNLLAFNASIEAARAGEHGVGFSIVAGEVRKLAERSSEAAQQIAALIEESEARVAQGSEVSRRASDAFQRIVDSVARTNEAIGTISGATDAQVDASRSVNDLIAKIAGSATAA